MANSIIFASGSKSKIEAAVKSGVLDYPSLAYVTDKTRLAFIDKNLDINLIKGDDYDDMADVPIINKYGTVGNIVVLSDLEDGIYSVSGQYRICADDTVYVTSKKILFFIDSDGTNKYVTKMGNEISLYAVEADSNNIKEDSYALKTWVEDQINTIGRISDDDIAELF